MGGRGIGVAVAAMVAVWAGVAAAQSPDPGPSFSCAEATTPIERGICASPWVSRQDRYLSGLYRRVLDGAADEATRKALTGQQRAWVAARNKECATAPDADPARLEECLSAAYARRILDLHASSAPADWPAMDALIPDMATAPDRVAETLASMTSPAAALERLLILHAFMPASPERDATIAGLKAGIDEPAFLSLDPYAGRELGEPRPYDGSDSSIVSTLRVASSSGLIQNASAFYAVPCPVLRQRPGLLNAVGAIFGGNRDNFLPLSGCAWGRGSIEGFPAEAIAAFVQTADRAVGPSAFNSGTLRYGLLTQQAAAVQIMALDPRRVLNGPRISGQRPYEIWGYLSVDNHRSAAVIDAAFNAALEAVIAFHEDSDLTEEERWMVARKGLFGAVAGADCGGASAPTSFRKLILDGAAPMAVEAFAMGEGWRNPDVLYPFRSCSEYAGMDPLIHLAVTRPALLDPLAAIAASVPAEERPDLDLVLDPGARNRFGKTPLMSAAQWNSPAGIEWLLARTVDVNAVTAPGDDYSGPRHGHRTALMYAAANASLPVIRRLLEAGADKGLADTQGLRAVDWLVGKGPVPANPVLSDAERAEAERLLE